MSAIISISIKKEDLDKLDPSAFIKGKSATYIPLSIMVDDKQDKFGNSVSVQLQQSKEDREAKKPKVYLGNGKVVYVRGEVTVTKDLPAAGAESKDEPF